MLVAAGAIKEGSRIRVKRMEAFDDPVFQRFAPLAVRREYQPIVTDMIPQTSWGSSLMKLLTPTSWEGVRKPCMANAGYVCECCGTEPPPVRGSSRSPVEVHEIWSFEEPENGQPGDWGIQHLESVACLCHACHLMFHPGLANMREKSRETAERLKDLNCWSWAQVQQNADYNNANYVRRSQFRWKLDVSALERLAPYAELVVNSDWEPTDDGMLVNTKAGAQTFLTGMPWRLSGGREMPEFEAPRPR